MSNNSLKRILENFVGDIGQKLDTHSFEDLLDEDGETLEGRDIGHEPEAWT